MIERLVGRTVEMRFVFLTCLLVTIAQAALLIVASTHSNYAAIQEFTDRAADSLAVYAILLRESNLAEATEQLSRVRAQTRSPDVLVFVQLPDGTIVGLDEQRVVSGLGAGGAGTREIQIDGSVWLSWATQIVLQDGIEVRLVVAHDLGSARRRSGDLVLRLLFVALPLIIASYFLARSMAGRVLGPARRFVSAMDRVAQGEYPHETFVGELMEMGQWATSFNSMVEQLRQKHSMEKLLYEQEKMASVGHLAASVAHEIRNPLASISSLTQLLGSRTKGDEKTQEYTAIILSEVDRLNSAIEQLLAFARPVPARFERCNLTKIMHSVVILLGFEARQAGIRLVSKGMSSADGGGADGAGAADGGLVVDGPDGGGAGGAEDDGGGVFVFADPNQLKQVFINVLANSFQSIGASGGEVVVRWRVTPDERDVEVVIADDGPGIPDDVKERIFEPFFSTRKAGVGLGLAICRKILEGHGGMISTANRPRRGAVFVISLPLHRGGSTGPVVVPATVAPPREIR